MRQSGFPWHTGRERRSTGQGGPGAGSDPPPRRAGVGLELIIAVTVLAVLGLAIAILVLDLAGAPSGRGGLSAVLAVALVGFYASSRWLVRVEHRLRGEPMARRRSGRRRLPIRRRHHGPAAMAWTALLFAALSIGTAVVAVVNHGMAERSSLVQSHGIDATGTVTYVRNHRSCGRSSCSYTAAMGIAFAGPVDGTTTTTVHYRGTLALSAGESVLVRVDPHEPGYAELPGAPFKRTRDWVVMVILAVVSATVAALEARALARGLAARRPGRVATWG